MKKMETIKSFLRPLAEDGATLSRADARSLLEALLAGRVPDVEAASLLTVLATRGETADELTGFVEGMRAAAVPVPLTEEERAQLVDTCGTGGGGPSTFNISTGAALVAAAAGAKVAKHGNRAVTGRCGSADVLEALGVPVALTPMQSVECLRETNFTFLYAPALHPALKQVQPLRQALGFRTIFNLAGPLSNPAGARAQVIGVLAPSRVLLVGRALVQLGTDRAFVVHGTDGMDELTLTGESIVARIEHAPGISAAERAARLAPANGLEPLPPELKAARVTPEMAGLERAPLEEFTGGDAATNAAILYDVITDIRGPRRDIVLLNAAAALVAAGIAVDLKEGVERAAEAIESGEAASTLARLRAFSKQVGNV